MLQGTSHFLLVDDPVPAQEALPSLCLVQDSSACIETKYVLQVAQEADGCSLAAAWANLR